MSNRFIIALTAEARRSTPRIDLAQAIRKAEFQDLRVIERATSGKSVTVEMPAMMVSEVRRRLPFAIVERAVSLSLLDKVV
jgi:hypothetical protein